ncbi:MAG: Rrf2 family transcriptional regulator [Bacteroidales bacterium]|nr:Rrf2 family transcriptional regulator [Bacteroidales bacterium]MCB8999783.1 Rrf2 family transcriptional regulator [Bacteroidales bacterium]
MLSSTCKYAIRAVLYLSVNSEDGKKIGIKQISKELSIPTPFLGKILQSLAKHKLLSSTKGPNGGFSLGKKPDEIHLMDIVEIIDGMDSFNNCVVGVKFCSEQENPCALHSRYAALREEIKGIFEKETIAELSVDIIEGKLGYVI